MAGLFAKENHLKIRKQIVLSHRYKTLIFISEDADQRNMKFGTVINCIDGRIQLPVHRYLKDHYDIDYFDSVTEAGPIRILTERKEQCRLISLKEQIRVSMEAHQSRFIAVVGHHDCAGNPVGRAVQEKQIEEALQYLKKAYGEGISYVGLYVNDQWQVEEYLKLGS